MHSVPFRVIAMVGVEDGVFPRASRPRAWDPFAQPAPYEHDRRILDRHLFLESILCARDVLLVFGRGFESVRGQRVPMSVVVEELAELLEPDSTQRSLVRAHPLQPWSPRSFADAARLPYGKAVVDAAQTVDFNGADSSRGAKLRTG